MTTTTTTGQDFYPRITFRNYEILSKFLYIYLVQSLGFQTYIMESSKPVTLKATGELKTNLRYLYKQIAWQVRNDLCPSIISSAFSIVLQVIKEKCSIAKRCSRQFSHANCQSNISLCHPNRHPEFEQPGHEV